MSFEIPGVLWRRDPQANEVPLVFDSPHSGSSLSRGFRFCCPLADAAPRRGRLCRRTLRRRAGAWRDADRRAVPAQLSSIPTGRSTTRRALLDGVWPASLRPPPRRGRARCAADARPGMPIYDRKLAVDEVLARIERCHTPYHRVLADACDALHRKFGASGTSIVIRCRRTRAAKEQGRLRRFRAGRPRRHDLRA